MVVYILCPECSEDLAEIYPFYNLVKNKFCEQILSDIDIDIDKVDFKTDILVNSEFILNSLQIKKMCCISHILGATSFDSLI
jgi:hypothetical protein